MISQDLIDRSTQTLPLESGDKLSREEFERRYMAMPEVKKAELIEGTVYMASPLRIDSHGNPHGRIVIWLGTYEVATPGTLLGDNSTVRLDLDNEPQPDVLLMIVNGGQSEVSKDGYVEGAPELVIEVAASSASIDMHDKLIAYQRNRVQEYLVWRVYEKAFDWFHLVDGKYEQMPANAEGIICSEVFPGLWLAKDALLRNDFAKVLEVLQQGLASPEHQAFVAGLAENKRNNS
jgi:Uma2 family endonuclease